MEAGRWSQEVDFTSSSFICKKSRQVMWHSADIDLFNEPFSEVRRASRKFVALGVSIAQCQKNIGKKKIHNTEFRERTCLMYAPERFCKFSRSGKFTTTGTMILFVIICM